jgi:hypothetical protein
MIVLYDAYSLHWLILHKSLFVSQRYLGRYLEKLHRSHHSSLIDTNKFISHVISLFPSFAM